MSVNNKKDKINENDINNKSIESTTHVDTKRCPNNFTGENDKIFEIKLTLTNLYFIIYIIKLTQIFVNKIHTLSFNYNANLFRRQ
jgi:hypothetical protein